MSESLVRKPCFAVLTILSTIILSPEYVLGSLFRRKILLKDASKNFYGIRKNRLSKRFINQTKK
jgi:hypothetical protein